MYRNVLDCLNTVNLFVFVLQFSSTDVRSGERWLRWHVGGVGGGRAVERRYLQRGLPAHVQVRSISEGHERGGGRGALSVCILRDWTTCRRLSMSENVPPQKKSPCVPAQMRVSRLELLVGLSLTFLKNYFHKRHTFVVCSSSRRRTLR